MLELKHGSLPDTVEAQTGGGGRHLYFVHPGGVVHNRAGHPLEHWRHPGREGVEEGSRNSTLASLCGHLLRHGVDPQVALELLLAWNRARCRPPLADNEVAQVVDSIARLHEQKSD